MTALTRIDKVKILEGVNWKPLDFNFKDCDLFIANRAPELLSKAPVGSKKLLWLHNPGNYLNKNAEWRQKGYKMEPKMHLQGPGGAKGEPKGRQWPLGGFPALAPDPPSVPPRCHLEPFPVHFWYKMLKKSKREPKGGQKSGKRASQNRCRNQCRISVENDAKMIQK